MIVNNSPLGFSKQSDGCSCADSSFSLPVALSDNTAWQIDMACDEITGTNDKLPCESNQIGQYTEDFKRYEGDVEEGLLDEYLISATNISFTDFQDAGNIFSTETGFLEANRCYFLRYTISGYVEGWIQTISGSAGEAERTTGPRPARRANGTYTEIFCTDANGRLRFQIGTDDDPGEVNTFILSNIFIGCIRYSELYELTIDEADEDLVTFASQTSVCKDTTTVQVIMSLREIPFIIGQTYRICFNLNGSTVGQVELLFNSTTPIIYTGNGRYCVELEYDTAATQLQFIMEDIYDGCITDISVHLIPDYRIELFDSEGAEVEDGLIVEQIEDTLKVRLNTGVAPGCYQIGIADSCSNFMSQFYGNILNKPIYSERILDANESLYPITVTNGEYSLQFTDWDDLANGTHTFSHYFIIQDSICCSKLYDMAFNMTLTDNGNTINFINIQIILATDFAAQDTIVSPTSSESFTFDDIIAGDCTKDLKGEIGTDSDFLVALIGSHGAFIRITTEIVKANNTDPEITFTTVGDDSYIIMDQTTPQFCPEYYSATIAVTTEAPCDTVLVKYRNSQNAFDFDYTSPGYTEDDGFYNQLRIPGKLWKPNYPKVVNIQKNSTGFRSNYYTDSDKKKLLTTGLLPEYVHDALALALGHDYLEIEAQQLVCESEEYAPSWVNSTELAPVEVELFVQQLRKLNTKC